MNYDNLKKVVNPVVSDNILLREDECCPDEKTDEKHSIDPTRLCQWRTHGSGMFSPCSTTIQHILPGVYEPRHSGEIGLYLASIPFRTDKLLIFPDPIYIDVIDSIKSFWSKKSYYDKYQFTFKRGILLYGEPGCGKSCILSQCMSHLVEEVGGIVINITDNQALQYYQYLLPQIREIEPTRPIITILEDLDVLVQRRSSMILNMLDGVRQIENIVYIATTNYPELLEERVLNRPSRFDRRFHIGTPSAKVRKFYFQNKINPKDLEQINLNMWIDQTDGFSIAHLKELIISVFVLDYSFEESIKHLNIMMDNSKIQNCKLKKQSGIGFK